MVFKVFFVKVAKIAEHSNMLKYAFLEEKVKVKIQLSSIWLGSEYDFF